MKKQFFIVSTLIFSTSMLLSETAVKQSSTSQTKKESSHAKNQAVTNKPDLQVKDKLKLTDFKEAKNGIKYKIIKKSQNQSKPLLGEKVTVHYTGWLLEGKDTVGIVFDSSVTRNKTFSFTLGAKQVISGWEFSVADMNIGEKRIVILPPKQAYGAQSTGKIPSNSTLIFEIELFKAE